MRFTLTSKQREALALISTVAKYFLLYGGSRSGKTAFIIYIQLLMALEFPTSRHLISRLHLSDLKSAVIHDTFPKVATLMSKELGQYVKTHLNKSDFFIKFPNDSAIWFGGLSDKDRSDKILGNEYLTIFLNEVSQLSYDSFQKVITRGAQHIPCVRNKFFLDCNPPTKNHWSYKLFIENIDPKDKLPKRKQNYAHLRMNPVDNPHLPKGYMDTLDDLSERQKKRFRDGEYQSDIEGALWKQEMIDRNRCAPLENYTRIVIGVDPATSNKKSSDETGIIAVGKKDDQGYVLADRTGKYSPAGWAKEVAKLYHELEADRVVCEVNQGGDMVEHTLRVEDKSLSIKQIRAFKGKSLRAEPVVALYEKDRVHHVQLFPDLDDQLIEWVPGEGDSPDRVDALVYALTDLLIKNKTASIRAL